VSFHENYLTSIQNSFNKISNINRNINQNDAKARLTIIDEITTKSLERIKKETNHSPITFATVRGEKGQQSHKSGLLVLLDTGCSHSIVMSAAMAKKHVKWKRSTASFNMAAGQYLTNHMAKMLFTLLEFSELKILHWEFHLEPEKESQGTGYDMIIGHDLMQALGVIIDFMTRTVSWDDICIGMCDIFAKSKTYRELHMIMQQSTKPPSVKEQTGRTVRILDAHYEAADL
jgi:GR25 family glycosyltransferase involved in LPS biosynthesis